MKLFFTAMFLGLVSISCLFVSTQTTLASNYGLDETAQSAFGSDFTKIQRPVTDIIGSIIGTALSIISVIFFILMVYGGFLWMTAHGKSDQVDKAQDTITAAIIGIIVVLAAYAITNFVFTSVTPQAPTAEQAP